MKRNILKKISTSGANFSLFFSKKNDLRDIKLFYLYFEVNKILEITLAPVNKKKNIFIKNILSDMMRATSRCQPDTVSYHHLIISPINFRSIMLVEKHSIFF